MHLNYRIWILLFLISSCSMDIEHDWIIMKSEEDNPLIISFDPHLSYGMIESRIRDSNENLVKIPIQKKDDFLKIGNSPFTIKTSLNTLNLYSFEGKESIYYRVEKNEASSMNTTVFNCTFEKVEGKSRLLFTNKLKTKALKYVYVLSKHSGNNVEYGTYSIFNISNSFLLKYNLPSCPSKFFIVQKLDLNTLKAFTYDSENNPVELWCKVL